MIAADSVEVIHVVKHDGRDGNQAIEAIEQAAVAGDRDVEVLDS